MNNKGFVQIVTVLLLLASIYQLSFTAVTNSVEGKAEEAAVKLYPESVADYKLLRSEYERNYLDSIGPVEVYPGLGFTYQQCKENELNLGLDLQGGMNVTLEVETPAVIEAMAGKTTDQAYLAAFNRAKAIRQEEIGEQ